MKLSSTRATAKKLGASTYFTGKPCPRGHIAPRLTASCYCLECNNQDGYKWNRANRAKRNAFTRKYAGLPQPTRPCPTHCECCGCKPRRELALDHDHKTGRFRGWVCSNCNTGIGMLGDNIEGVTAAAAYLERSAHAS